MNMGHVTKAWVLLLVGVTLVAGCARSPEAKKARHLERGDKARLHLALAALYVRKLETAKAERDLQEAVAKEPQSLDAHTALGDFYIGKGDVTQAEREYRTAAELVPVASPERLRLAEFYL